MKKAMRLIPRPEWTEPVQPDLCPRFGADEYRRVQAQRSSWLAVVHQAVQSYLDEQLHVADGDTAVFPSADRLSGDYYLGVEAYWVNDEAWFAQVGRVREYRFSIQARCLEHPRQADQLDCDYLGLEVHFDWDPATGRVLHRGDVDSSII